MTYIFVAFIMLYGPFLWCFLRKESYSKYGLVITWNIGIAREIFFWCFLTFFFLTPVALLWPEADLPRRVSLSFFLTYSAAGLSSAIIEEVFFRGFLQTLMAKYFALYPRIVMCALIFAFSHMFFRTSPIFLATFFPGLIMAHLREKTGSVFPSITYHFLGNVWAIWFFP